MTASTDLHQRTRDHLLPDVATAAAMLRCALIPPMIATCTLMRTHTVQVFKKNTSTKFKYAPHHHSKLQQVLQVQAETPFHP
jgi:hypothetical protein